MTDKILVTGANGFVGAAILAALDERGDRGVGLVRRGRRAAAKHVREVEAWTEEALAASVEGCSAVVHAASVVHRPDAPVDEYRRFNVEATRALLSAAERRGVRDFVYLSTIKVYGETPEGVVDEETPVRPEGAYAETKVEAERLVLSHPGFRSKVVLRLAPVFGPGDKGNIRTILRAIARRRFFLPGDGRTRKSLVHVSTVVESVLRAIDVEANGTFVVSDRETPTMRELVDAAATAIGRSPPISIPAGLVFALAGAVETGASWLSRRPPVTRDLIRKSLTSTVFSSARLERELGVACHVELARALRGEADWMRRERLL